MSRARTLLLVLVGGFLFSAAPAFGQGRALVVGIERYADGSVYPGAGAGAEAYAAILRDHLGVSEDRIVVLKNEAAVRERVIAELNRISESRQDERVYLYFAGRAITRQVGREPQTYLLPYDGQVAGVDSIRGGIWLRQLRFMTEVSGARDALVVLDLPVAGIRGTYPREVTDESADTLAAQHVLAAGRVDESAPNDSLSALVRAFRAAVVSGRADTDGDVAVSTFELARYVQRVVPALTGGALHPQYRMFSAKQRAMLLPAGTEPADAEVVQAEQAPAIPEAPAHLEVNSRPTEAQVTIDGVAVGIAPVVLPSFDRFGEVSIGLSKPGFADQDFVLDLRPGDIRRIDTALVPTASKLIVTDLPEESQLYVDGALMEPSANGEYWLELGPHTIQVYTGAEGQVAQSIISRSMAEIRLRYDPSVFSPEALTPGMFVPGAAQLSKRTRLKGAILLGSSVLFAGTSLLSQVVYTGANQDYEAAYLIYMNANTEDEVLARRAEMLEKYDRASLMARTRNASLGLLGVVYAYNFVDLLLFHSRVPALLFQMPVPGVRTTLRLVPSAHGPSGSLAFRF